MITKSRTYHLCVPMDMEREDWIRKLHEVVSDDSQNADNDSEDDEKRQYK